MDEVKYTELDLEQNGHFEYDGSKYVYRTCFVPNIDCASHFISFCLYPDDYQPSGTFNISRTGDFMLNIYADIRLPG